MEHDRAIVELLVASLEALENRLRHVDIVRIGLEVPLSTFPYQQLEKGCTHDRDHDVGLLRRLLELVEVREGSDDSLHAEFVRKTLRLLGRADVESEVELLEELGGGENLAEEGATNVAWLTLE